MCGNLRLGNNSRVEIKRVANTGEAPELGAIGVVSFVSGGGGAAIIIFEAAGLAQSLPGLPGRQVVDGVGVGEHRDGGGVASSVGQGGGRELYQDGVHTVCLTVCKF